MSIKNASPAIFMKAHCLHLVLSLDTYIKHLHDKHLVNIREPKMNSSEREKYLPIRTI